MRTEIDGIIYDTTHGTLTRGNDYAETELVFAYCNLHTDHEKRVERLCKATLGGQTYWFLAIAVGLRPSPGYEGIIPLTAQQAENFLSDHAVDTDHHHDLAQQCEDAYRARLEHFGQPHAEFLQSVAALGLERQEV